jgi:hypothetical protein
MATLPGSDAVQSPAQSLVPLTVPTSLQLPWALSASPEPAAYRRPWAARSEQTRSLKRKS